MKNQRRIVLQNANNFRDLGGYAAEGGITAWGKLFRTDGLSRLNEQDWDTLRNMGVYTLVDLRSDGERVRNPITAPADLTYLKLPFISPACKKTTASSGNSNENGFIASLVMKYSYIYRNSLHEISTVLNALTDAIETNSAAFFCSAGKDRTGMTAATVLYLCGVAEDDIIADYIVSCTYNSSPERGAYRYLSQTMDLTPYGGKMPDHLAKSDPETIKEVLAFFKENHVSALLNENGFSYERQALLKERMIWKDV